MGAATSIELGTLDGAMGQGRDDERRMYHAHAHRGNTIVVTRVLAPGQGRLLARSAVDARSRDEIAQAHALYPLAPSSSADRMVMLMEALVEFLEAVEGNLQHRDDATDNRTPQDVLELLPCRAASSSDLDKECYICLSHFQADEQMRTLPCGHEFHVSCVDKWLLDVHRTCPCCRLDICASAGDGEPKTPDDIVRANSLQSRVSSRMGSREMAVEGMRRSTLGNVSDATADRRLALIEESSERGAERSGPSMLRTGSLAGQEAAEQALSAGPAGSAHRSGEEASSAAQQSPAPQQARSSWASGGVASHGGEASGDASSMVGSARQHLPSAIHRDSASPAPMLFGAGDRARLAADLRQSLTSRPASSIPEPQASSREEANDASTAPLPQAPATRATGVGE